MFLSIQTSPDGCQGYNQEEGIDYDETFIDVSRMEGIRILVAFVAFMGFRLYQMHVKSAFLNGNLKKKVYVKQPPGFVIDQIMFTSLIRLYMG